MKNRRKNPVHLSLADQLTKLQRGQISPLHLVKNYLQRIHEYRHLNAFICTLKERAINRAQQLTAEGPLPTQPLYGIPFAVKDQMDVRGVITTYGSNLTAQGPAHEDAQIIQQLEAAGAILIGTLNTHEYHLGGTEVFPYGIPKNPHNEAHDPGSSSSGAAIAVAANLCTFSIGSDTGGSIRGPAAYCGVYGLKPTFGVLERTGIQPLAESLDTPGFFTKTARDMHLILAALERENKLQTELEGVSGLRIGVVTEMLDPRLSDRNAVKKTLEVADRLLAAGAVIERVTIPLFRHTQSVTDVLVIGEAFKHHESAIRQQYEDYDINTRTNLLVAATLPTRAFTKAIEMRGWIQKQVSAQLNRHDFLLGPTANAAPPLRDPDSVGVADKELRSMPLTQIYNLSGNPALSVPIGTNDDGLPLAVQVAGRQFEDQKLLSFAEFL